MKRLIIADSHLGQRPGDIDAMVALVSDSVTAGVGELVYLGDAFQYLIGLSKFWTEGVRRVLEAWQQARQSGLRVVLIEGNRDFFLDQGELVPLRDWSGRVYEFVAGSRRFRMTHGDRVNRRDIKYHFWASVSKSGPARLWAHLLPRPVAVAIVRSMEARLARTNYRFRVRKPVAALRRQAEQAWSEGIDVVLWGHFHTPWDHSRGDRTAMVVPAWLATRSALMVDGRGTWSWVDVALTPCGTPPRMD